MAVTPRPGPGACGTRKIKGAPLAHRHEDARREEAFWAAGTRSREAPEGRQHLTKMSVSGPEGSAVQGRALDGL